MTKKLTKTQQNEIMEKMKRFNGILNDCQIEDVTKLIPYNTYIEKIDGWNLNPIYDGEYMKTYYLKFEDYKDILVVNFYTDPQREWKVRSTSIYFS